MKEILFIKSKSSNCEDLLKKIEKMNYNISIYNSFNSKTISNKKYDISIIEFNIFKTLKSLQFLLMYENTKFIYVLTDNQPINVTNCQNITFNNENSMLQYLKNINDNYTKNKIEKMIKDELEYLGYKMSYIGTKYLIDTIYILYCNNNYINNLKKNVYPIIAKKYDKSINNIKCNINVATSNMFSDNKEEKIKKYLGIDYIPKTGFKLITRKVLNNIT